MDIGWLTPRCEGHNQGDGPSNPKGFTLSLSLTHEALPLSACASYPEEWEVKSAEVTFILILSFVIKALVTSGIALGYAS